MTPGRVDDTGAAFAGSQLQTQLYVNKRTESLDAAIVQAVPALADASFDWRSPLAEDGYREYYGKAFLTRVGLEDHIAALQGFWPDRGPQWDALAVVHRRGAQRPGLLLVEGKSYPGEMLKGSGTASKRGSQSRALIERSLRWTQDRLGVQGQTPRVWAQGPLYQNANRLAHLCWLQSLGVRAWFVHLLFTDDPHGPTTGDAWERTIEHADESLGLARAPVDGVAHVLLPAGTRGELLRG